jgi:hypothetical protein
MSAYNTESALARLLRPHYARGDDEARALLREAFTLTVDLQITDSSRELETPREDLSVALVLAQSDRRPSIGTIFRTNPDPIQASPAANRKRAAATLRRSRVRAQMSGSGKGLLTTTSSSASAVARP